MGTARSLSDDILYLVFIHALPSFITPSAPLDPLTTPPLNFSAVCRSWRTVVSSHPNLWSTINVYSRSLEESKLPLHPSVPYYVAKWLRNSKSAMLDVYFVIVRTGDDPVYDELFALVLSQYRRLRDITVIVVTRSVKGDPITLRCSPSAISIFYIQHRTQGTWDSPIQNMVLDVSLCTVTGAASQLQELNVSSGVKWVLPPSPEALHLPHLRELSFCTDLSESLDDTFGILSACPNISKLWVEMQGTFSPSNNNTESILLMQLSQLTFTSPDEGTANQLLYRLSCPSLRSCDLTIKHPAGVVTPSFLRDLASFLSRRLEGHGSGVHPPLSKLHLRCNEVASARGAIQQVQVSYREHVTALTELLSLLRHLDWLTLDGLAIDDELIEKLTVRRDSDSDSGEVDRDVLCPSLSDLCIVCEYSLGIRKTTMEEMIVSRRKPEHSMLRRVALHIPGFRGFGEESERLKACMEEGLEVNVYS